MTLRILLASDFYPPFIGGAERQTQLLAQELALRSYAIQVATVWHAGLAHQESAAGVDVARLNGLTTGVGWFSSNTKRRYHPPFPDPGIVLGLRRLIRHFRPDVIHASGWIAYSCAAALIGKSIPLLVSARDYGYTCATRTMLHTDRLCAGPSPIKCGRCAAHTYGLPKAGIAVGSTFIGKTLLRRKVSATHSVSTFVQQVIQRDLLRDLRKNADGTRTITIADIVIPSFSEQEGDAIPETHPLPTLPERPFILFVGSLQRHKGIITLLDAYHQLPADMQEAVPLVLIGTTWPDTPTFPPGVTILRNVPHPAVMHAWKRCLFGVAPSIWPEPLGGVIREGMLCSKALIATRIGGNTDLIHDGETGLLVPPGDSAALAAAMQRLIDDPALRDSLGTSAQERARAFTADAVIPRFEALYTRLADHSGGRA